MTKTLGQETLKRRRAGAELVLEASEPLVDDAAEERQTAGSSVQQPDDRERVNLQKSYLENSFQREKCSWSKMRWSIS